MRSHHGVRGRRVLAMVTGAALAAGLLAGSAVPALGATPPPCRVVNVGTAVSYRTLQGAVNKAKSGATLRVTGVCKGTTSIGPTKLTIVGKRTKATGVPTLDGKQRSHTLSVAPGGTVVVRGLVIRNGAALEVDFPGNSGGGVLNGGTLTLKRVTVEKNTARESGGGIRNDGSLTMIDTIVRKNTMQIPGDGCGVTTTSGIAMTNGRIAGNHPGPDGACFGGGLIVYDGAAVLSGTATIANNVAGARNGGGVAVQGLSASLTMKDTSSITGNTTAGSGGGVYAYGTFTLEAGTITGNTADTGGGIYGSCATVVVPVPTTDHVFGNTPVDQIVDVC